METTTRSIDTLAQQIRIIDQLRKISRSLRKLYEYECNYGQLSPRQEKRHNNLRTQADMLAHEIGYKAYHQSDPRGVALYLIDDNQTGDDYRNYNHGIALY